MDWLIDRLVHLLIGWLIDWLIDWLTHWTFTDWWLIVWYIECNWLTGLVSGSLIGSSILIDHHTQPFYHFIGMEYQTFGSNSKCTFFGGPIKLLIDTYQMWPRYIFFFPDSTRILYCNSRFSYLLNLIDKELPNQVGGAHRWCCTFDYKLYFLFF